MNKKLIYDYSLSDLQDYLVENGFKKFAATQIFEGIYKKHKNINEITNISKDLKQHLEDNFIDEDLEVVEKQVAKDKTTKWLFKLKDGEYIEAVLMRFHYGNSVCVTTQVGCNMGCKFCASGLIKKKRDLTAGEIVQQVKMIDKYLMKEDKRVSHVVIMGIGEPFDNFDNTIKFINTINHDKGLGIGKRNITVSTSGLVDKIVEFSKLENQVNLAISLHATNDEKRTSIMPINAKYNLNQLMNSLRTYSKNSNRRITIEYIVLDGINDSDEDAEELYELLHAINAYVNLIPYNEVPESGFKRSSRYDKFADKLFELGANVTIRREKGHDIDAACGQLRSKREGITND